MKRTLLTLLVGLAACGPAQDAPPPERSPEPELPASTRPLRLRLLEPVPGLDPVVQAFSERHGVPVVLESGNPETTAPEDPVTLAEVRVVDLGWLGPSQRLRPWPRVPEPVLPALAAAGTWAHQTLGVPWRLEATVPVASPDLLADGSLWDWPSFGRLLRARGWSLPPARALDLFLALHAAAGGSFVGPDGDVRLDGPAAVEALDLAIGLAETASTPREATDGSAVALVGLTDLAARSSGVPFGIPGPEPTDPPTARLPVQPTVWVLPQGGPHRDLARPLVERLLAADVAALLAATGRWLPASPAWDPTDPTGDRLRALRDGAVWLPAMSGGRRPHELLAHAVDQALTRKRSPQDALRDAQQSLLTQPQHR